MSKYHNAGMEHGLKDIAFYLELLYILRFYFEKHITPHAVCHNFSLVRDKQLGAPACPKRVYQGRQLRGCELFRPCSLSRRVTRPLGRSCLVPARSGVVVTLTEFVRKVLHGKQVTM